MRTNVNKWVFFAAIATGITLFAGSCKKEMSSNPASTTSYNLYMTDSPADYQAVNVNITGAEIHSDVSGWVKLNVKAGIYNLLSLANGKDTLIATGKVAVGHVSQIRLFVASGGNSVVINNVSYPLEVPSGMESGIKLQVNSELVSGTTYNFTIDFDAGMSVVPLGNGTYLLKPVIRPITFTTGTIKGTVSPEMARAAIVAFLTTGTSDSAETSGEFWERDTAVSFAFGDGDDRDDGFRIRGLEGGLYTVIVVPLPPFSTSTFTNVSVTEGQVTDMGTITLH